MLDFEVEAENEITENLTICHIVAKELKHHYPSFPLPFTDKDVLILTAAAVETVHPDWEQFPDLVRSEARAHSDFVRCWLVDQGLISYLSSGLYKVEAKVLSYAPLAPPAAPPAAPPVATGATDTAAVTAEVLNTAPTKPAAPLPAPAEKPAATKPKLSLDAQWRLI